MKKFYTAAPPCAASFPPKSLFFPSEHVQANCKAEHVFGGFSTSKVVAPKASPFKTESRRAAGCGAASPDFLGKNSSSPAPPKRSEGADSASSPCFDSLPVAEKAAPRRAPNRLQIRVATAARLMISHFNATGVNLRGSSVAGCGRWRRYGADPFVAEIEVRDGGVPRMKDHFVCGNGWTCELCDRAGVSQHRSWVRAAFIPALESAGMTAALVTLTLSHSYAEDWSLPVQRLFAAYALLDRRMKKPYLRIGSLGKVRNLEAPVGVSGLHPHLHILLTYKKGADLAGIESAMRDGWARAVIEVGGKSNACGFDFKPDCVNTYIAKMETAHEMSSSGTKSAKTKGVLLGTLLDRAALGCRKSAGEWIRAVAALAGRHKFQAGGLSKKLGILPPSEWQDEEVQAERAANDADTPDPVLIRYPQGLHLKATGPTGRAGLALILRSARAADSARVLRVVAALCAEIDRKESGVDAVHRTDADLQVLVNAAGVRRLLPSEVPFYLEAKARGFVLRE